jgi:thiol:disulfide interchange protein DsbD
MAFPLYLTAVWLLWVVGRQTGVDGMAMVTVGCVLIFLALWLWRRETPLARRSSLIAAIAALLLLFGPWMIETNDTGATAVNNTNVYSSERVSALRSEGKPVFVNVTADWCITCLVNERMALSRRSVLEGFTSNNIAYLKGDWTNSDPIITELLNEYGRSGVPLYLLFPAESSKPAILLPQILTPDIVLEAFSSL